MKSRKVQLAVAQHPKTPRHVSLPLLRHLFTFELMQVTLNPVGLADIKKAAEDALLHRLETISLGERVSLALRASGNVAGELLFDSELRVLQAALENPRLTEAGVVKALLSPGASALLVQAVCEHPKWSLRKDVTDCASAQREHSGGASGGICQDAGGRAGGGDSGEFEFAGGREGSGAREDRGLRRDSREESAGQCSGQ